MVHLLEVEHRRELALRSLKSTAENFVSMVAEFGERSIRAWVGAGVASALPGTPFLVRPSMAMIVVTG